MSNSIFLEKPSCTLQKLLEILGHPNDLHSTTKELEIVINSKELNKYIKEENNYFENSFIYFARVGNKFNGNALANDIVNSKNYFISTKKGFTEYAQKNKINDEYISNIMSSPYFIAVEKVEEFLNKILENIFQIKNFNFHSIATTGTNGKTSTVQICSQLYEKLSNKISLRIGTLGLQIKDLVIESSHVTTPDYPTFLQVLNHCKKNNISQIIMEATSHGLQEKRISDWLFDIAIYTNLTQDHLDYHGTMEAYLQAKLKLFNLHLKKDGCAVLCLNNDYWTFFCEAAASQNRTLFAIGDTEKISAVTTKYKNDFKNIYCLEIIESTSNLAGNSGIIKFSRMQHLIKKFTFETPLIGQFQLYNILCAVAAMLQYGFPIDDICHNLKSLQNIPGRLEIVNTFDKNTNKQPTVLIDYAHSPDALEKAILVSKEVLKNEKKGRLITVFGCGGDRDKTKRPLMGKIAATYSDFVIVTSDNPRTEDPDKIIDDIFSGISYNTDNCLREKNREQAIALAIKMSSEFDIILVAGKGHEDYQIIGEKKYPFSDSLIAKSLLTKEKK